MKVYECLNCGMEHKCKPSHANKYCNNKCQAEYQTKQKVQKWLSEGNWETKNRQLPPWMKRHIRERDGKCVSCGISEWNGSPITLEVDHKDGTWFNNNVDNLRSLCPNCHSQTETYKARNRGNGRTLLPNSSMVE